MNYKIVKTPANYPDVLIQRHTDNEVFITATYAEEGDPDIEYCNEEKVVFENRVLAQGFVANFTEQQAVEWLDEEGYLDFDDTDEDTPPAPVKAKAAKKV